MLPPETHSYVMVVADGMGGMKLGEVASRAALQTMVELSGLATSWVMKLNDMHEQQIQQRIDAYAAHAARSPHMAQDTPCGVQLHR